MPITHKNPNPMGPRRSYKNYVAFLKALGDVPTETRDIIDAMIDKLAHKLMEKAYFNIRFEVCRRQASEAIYQIIMKECFDELLLSKVNRQVEL